MNFGKLIMNNKYTQIYSGFAGVIILFNQYFTNNQFLFISSLVMLQFSS